ncbi:MAG TPA: hypothetical protein VGK18_02390 [Propionicimonas sp.]|uniref:hypothetical protein n=1 Tax=Propionicimonas sp. TaxID=1955623 RepID=UPI002F424CAC
MKDPKNRPLVYLIAGIVAIAAALYFMTLDTSIFDWFILGMGIVSIIKGVQEYWQLNGGPAGRRKKDGASGPDAGAPDDRA